MLGCDSLLKIGTLRFDRNELAGAFGDLGTFIPLVTALIIWNGLNPKGVLLSFGVLYIFVGLVFRVPIAVQPMKAIAAIMITQALQPSLLFPAGIMIGIIFIVLALSGAIDLISRVTPRSVIRGIQLGLGINLISIAFSFMQRDYPNGWILSVMGVAAVITLFKSKRFPPALVLLATGAGFSLFNGFSFKGIANNRQLDFPIISPPANINFMQAVLLLVIPQIPLTISNAILATSLLSQEYFPERKISARQLALSHGVMNLVAAFLGGVPVCHGAGGLAGHYRFGARSGGALLIIGVFMLVLGLFSNDGFIMQTLSLIPSAILGVLLFFTGLELAFTVKDTFSDKNDFIFALFVAALSVAFQYGYSLGLAGGIFLTYLKEKHCRRKHFELKR